MKLLKLWDTLTLIFIFLLSLILIASVIQLIVGETILAGFSTLTLKILNYIFTVSILLIITVLVLENGSPVRTVAWILVLFFLPIVGFILYLFFGRNWRKSRIFSRKGTDDIIKLHEHLLQNAYLAQSELSNAGLLTNKLIKLLENNNKAFLTCHNTVEIIPDTVEAFEKILLGIANAKSHIHIEYFSLANDSTGNTFKQALLNRAKDGIKIRLIYDAVGCWKLPYHYKQELRNAGIDLFPFLPSPFPTISSRLNYRNHRKLVIIDGKTAYLGGLNIGDKYMHKKPYFGYWRDSLVVLEGESVLSLQGIFLTDWFFVCKQNLLSEYLHKPEKPCLPLEQPIKSICFNVPVQIVSSGPDSDWESIMQVYFAAIAKAKNKVDITSPYLILNESLLMAMKTASLSGVKVRIILPSKADHFIVFWGSRSYYPELLQAGIELYEYQKGFMHAKVLIVDEEIVSIGTANMDLRSFNHNFELNAMLYDKSIAAEAEKQFEQDLTHSKRVLWDEFQHRSEWQKVKESICRLFSPLL